MKKLLYKGIEFDDFQLYREAENSSGCEYGYPTEEDLSTEEYEEANIYIFRRFCYGLECRTVGNSNKADGRNSGTILYGWYRKSSNRYFE